MLKSVLVSAFLLIFYDNPFINGATFENVEVTLVEHNEAFITNQSDWDVRKPKILITSDDSLVPYTKNRGNYTVTRIEIEHQNIPKLPIRSIYNIWIYGLSITHCKLEEIEPEAFSMIPVLKTVDLSYNKLKIIKNGVFSGLGISDLFLAKNQIETIEDRAFVNMKLKTIYLSDNKISTWNSGWFADTPVTSLHMTGNLIQELPLNAFAFENVGEYDRYDIDFENNQIKAIQPGAFNAVGSIFMINLKNNQIEELGSEVFTGITVIIYKMCLENNTISKINANIFGDRVKNINKIHLENNRLSEVPWKLLKNKKIENVILKNNPLKCSFAEEVDNWSKTSNFHGYRDYYISLTRNCV